MWRRVMDRGWGRGTFRDLVDGYLAPSGFVAQRHVEMGLPAERIHVVPNACADPWARGGEARDGEGAIYAGRLVPEKGVDVLVEAWRGVRAPLTIVGTGPEEPALRRAAADLPHVRFTGLLPHDRTQQAIADASLLVFPSRWFEPFGLGIIEAMACGKAVVASRLAGPAEIVEDGVTGLLVPPGDADALRDAARGLLADADRLRALGAAGRQRYLAAYSPAAHLQYLERIFDRLLAERRRAA
jgi:glycosyltransferase involved in cell wall biosynthesis